MNLIVKIDNIDRTEYISWPSFNKEDVINNQADNLSFETKCYGSKNWKPTTGLEVEVTDGDDLIFGGVIISVEETIDGDILRYSVGCKDWTHYLDRLVVERFTDQTVEEIIEYINTYYLSGFTVNNVLCNIRIKTIAFNKATVSQCLQTLADQLNFYWYVDYEKDIHFFSKNTENAPFSLSDTNAKYIPSSLRVSDDISQIKNVIFVRGGESAESSRSQELTGDGTQKQFTLGYKFSEKPTVTVGGVAKTVGVDFLDDDAGFDCLWDYNQKYVRFVSAPANSAAIVVTGTPLIPILIQAQDDESIAEYGVREFSITNKDIESKDEARQFANSQLEAYANKISTAYFETYEGGLRSGQIIRIQSDRREIDESFLIQRVTLQMRTPTDGLWHVELATMKTVGIISFLQKLLLDQSRQIEIAENEILEKGYFDNKTIEITEEITKATPSQDHQTVSVDEDIEKDPMGADTAPIFVLGPYFPSSHSDPYREARFDYSFILY